MTVLVGRAEAEHRAFLARCYHEAGHSVVATHLGWTVISVEAHPPPDDVDWESDDVEEYEGGGTELDASWRDQDYPIRNETRAFERVCRSRWPAPLAKPS
jgi:hypothetical protein